MLNLINTIYKKSFLHKFFSKHKTLEKFFVFLLMGGITTLLVIGFTILLTEVFNMYYALSYFIILIFNFFINFFASYKVTFRNKQLTLKKVILYILTNVIMLILDPLLVIAITKYLSIHYTIAIIISRFTFVILKFTFYNKVVFVDK